jgi:protease I
MSDLNGLKVAILVTDGFEHAELVEPRKALQDAGAQTSIVSPKNDKVKSWKMKEWGEEFPVDQPLEKAKASDYDALLLPGGVINPDKLRMEPAAVTFVKEFFSEDKPVAAICHGPWMVIEVGAAGGKKMASWPSLKTDIQNAGGTWKDEQSVVDGNLVTARKPDDIPAFSKAMIKLFQERAVNANAANR